MSFFTLENYRCGIHRAPIDRPRVATFSIPLSCQSRRYNLHTTYLLCPLAHPRPSTPARGVSAADLFPVTLASPNSQRRKSLPPLLPPSSLAIGNILATSTHRRLSQAALQHTPSVLRRHGPRQLVRLSQHHPPPLRLPPPPLPPWLKDPAPRMAQCLAASAAPCPPSLTSSAA